MEVIPTVIKPHHIPTTFPIYEDYKDIIIRRDTHIPGLTCRYECPPNQKENEDVDGAFYTFNTTGVKWTNREFSVDDQQILQEHLQSLLATKDKINIFEIGVHANPYDSSSTGTILSNKRDNDLYIGVDIVNKDFLNSKEKNIYTIQSDSINYPIVQSVFEELNCTSIDLFMVDGWHSLNKVYREWELYTPMLSQGGKVIFHDTNAHPGPYFVTKSIDTNMYRVQKYLNDIQDWGITVATKL